MHWRVPKHPMIQAELSRQLADLEDLKQGKDEIQRELVEKLHSRAIREPISLPPFDERQVFERARIRGRRTDLASLTGEDTNSSHRYRDGKGYGACRYPDEATHTAARGGRHGNPLQLHFAALG